MLTRKYYRMIARVIRDNTLIHNEHKQMLAQINKAGLVADLITEFKKDNNLFNATKFIDACDND